jgi:hypothetical protein
MKKPVVGLGALAIVGLCLVGGSSLAQKGVVVAPGTLPTAATVAQISCARGNELRVSMDKPKVTFYSEKPVGATAWTTHLSLKANLSGCPETTLELFSDEPEAREAIQTCAAIAAAVPPGHRLTVFAFGTNPVKPGIRIHRPLGVECSQE